MSDESDRQVVAVGVATGSVVVDVFNANIVTEVGDGVGTFDSGDKSEE